MFWRRCPQEQKHDDTWCAEQIPKPVACQPCFPGERRRGKSRLALGEKERGSEKHERQRKRAAGWAASQRRYLTTMLRCLDVLDAGFFSIVFLPHVFCKLKHPQVCRLHTHEDIFKAPLNLPFTSQNVTKYLPQESSVSLYYTGCNSREMLSLGVGENISKCHFERMNIYLAISCC